MLKFEKIYKILEKQISTNYQYLLAVASGIFLFFSFPKFGNKIFAWFSFLPLIFSVLLISNVKEVIVLSFITGIIGYCGILYWIVPTFVVAGEHWIFGLISTVLLSLYCSFYRWYNLQTCNLPQRITK
jgi:apolipoprotein N-acyltransferase